MTKIHSLHKIFKRPTIGLLFLVAGILWTTGCQKDDDPFANKVPQIELLSLTPQMVVEFNDSLVFNIKYRDNDGDLGENNPSVKNLFITDNRIGIVYDYRIQQLAPTGSAIAIEGTLQVVLNSVARTDTSLAQESATFSVYVKDRAGNKSNVVTSGVITIKGQ
jgi:hypothetical protein